MTRGRREAGPRSISALTVNRLSVYLRCLGKLSDEGVETISSQELADRFHLNSAQIRKDLAYFGEFGIRGVGYQIELLRRHLVQILGLDRPRPLMVVGAGNLGSALAHSFATRSGPFEVVAVLDTDPELIGSRIGGEPDLLIEDAEELESLARERRVAIGVVTTPAPAAQATCDRLVDAGVGAILNFAPAQVKVPDRIILKTIDLKVFLEELSFNLAHSA